MSADFTELPERIARAEQYGHEHGCTRLAWRMIQEFRNGSPRVELDSDSPDHVQAIAAILRDDG